MVCKAGIAKVPAKRGMQLIGCKSTSLARSLKPPAKKENLISTFNYNKKYRSRQRSSVLRKEKTNRHKTLSV